MLQPRQRVDWRCFMKKQVFRVDPDGFNGAWYPAPSDSGRGLIVMLGDSAEDYMARTGAKWLNWQGIHVMAMSADKKDYGHHNYPLERFGKAISFMKAHRCNKLGVIGASTTGMMALLAASCYPELSLTIAISPPDFVMEGFYQDGRDGMRERPGDNESTVTWQGKPLPYLPYAYRHPEYWKKILEESKAGGDKIASAATRSLPGKCLMNPSAGTLSRKKKGSRWRPFAGRSSSSAQKMMCCGIPADISAGWRNASKDILMKAAMKVGSMSTEPTLRFPSPC